MRLIPIAGAFLALLAVACYTSSDSAATATPFEPAIGPGPPQTVVFCPDCQMVEVTRVIDGLSAAASQSRNFELATSDPPGPRDGLFLVIAT